jgi:taurine dioxygenase
MTSGIESEVVTRVRGEPIQIIPTGAALGATVKGVALSDLDDAAFARIMQGWHDHSVLLFRDQSTKN